MDVWKDYKKYEAHEAEYEQWKNNLEQTEIKRSRYIKQHNLKMDSKDLARAKALLNAIDTMDEFSQSHAEEMETATETIQGSLIGLVSLAGIFIGMKAQKTKLMSKLMNKLLKNSDLFTQMNVSQYISQLISVPFALAASFPLISWAASKQVGASRKGRLEAMNKDLKNPAMFAVLTPEQEKQAKKIAKTIPVDKEMKKAVNARMGKGTRTGGSLKQAWNLITNESEYQKQKQEFDEKLKKQESRFNEKLSKKDIELAKKDRQLMAKVIEKMDYASQAYAEKTEFATNIIQAFAFAGAGINAIIANKITSLLKIKNPYINMGIMAAALLGTQIPLNIIGAKLQKQASRVGRYQVQKEFLNNPEQLMYIDEDKLPKGEVKTPEKKKENIFKFIYRIFKENREYNKHVKETGIKTKQYQKALEQIKLTPQQLKDAQTLQMNTFKTFNRVDDKSQQYAESVEAAGERIKAPIEQLAPIAGGVIGLLIGGRGLMENVLKGDFFGIFKSIIKFAAGGAVLPVAAKIGLDALFTKKQIKASRVADMLALKELSDYRHYVNYDNLHKDDAVNSAVKSNEQPAKQSGNVLDMLLHKKSA